MTHPRRLVREAIKAALVGRTDAGSRVSETRSLSYRTTELPAISVFTSEETTDEESRASSPRELLRRADIVVEAVTALAADAAVDDALDGLAEQVEAAMNRDTTLGGTCSDSVLISTELGTVDSGSRPMGAIQLTFAVWYYSGVPEAAEVDDLKTITAKTSVENAVHPDNQIEDRLDDLDE